MAKLKNNQTDNIDFLNPYTFVPFQKVPPKPEAWEQKYSSPEDLLTGWLDIELIPKTPIIIPDTAHREEIKVKNKNIHFFGCRIQMVYLGFREAVCGECSAVYTKH